MTSSTSSFSSDKSDNVLTLGIETATDVCSVALFEDDQLLEDRSVSEPRSHASQLVPLVQKALEGHGKSVNELELIAVSAGPGSYTGLRIGASTAKGLAFTSEAALVAVPSLEALALGAPDQAEHPVLTVFPSRRGEVYAAVYDVTGRFPSVIKAPAAIELVDWDEWLSDGDFNLVGPAAQAVLETLSSSRFHFADVVPSAVHVAKVGLERFKSGLTENVAAWEPYYLKAFVAKPPRPIFG